MNLHFINNPSHGLHKLGVVSSIVVRVEASLVNGINVWFVPLSVVKCDTRGLQTILLTTFVYKAWRLSKPRPIHGYKFN